MFPGYLELYRTGQLQKRVVEGYSHLTRCSLCGCNCLVNRQFQKGFCRTGMKAVVCSYGPHFGEEFPLRGRLGSGTIFFAWCSLRCQFCQNYELSQEGEGREVEPEDLAKIMLILQEWGCHNINLVSPTHVVPMILAAVEIAVKEGLILPLVYNSGGYDSLEALKLLDGVVDIYLPDMKYSDAATALQYSQIQNYPQINRLAVKEMHRQVGDLVIDSHGIAQRGLMVRHLVLPENLAGTDQIARFLVQEISRHTYVNLMSQYHPCYLATSLPPLNRPITQQEYANAKAAILAAGIYRLDARDV